MPRMGRAAPILGVQKVLPTDSSFPLTDPPSVPPGKEALFAGHLISPVRCHQGASFLQPLLVSPTPPAEGQLEPGQGTRPTLNLRPVTLKGLFPQQLAKLLHASLRKPGWRRGGQPSSCQPKRPTFSGAGNVPLGWLGWLARRPDRAGGEPLSGCRGWGKQPCLGAGAGVR